ncbi:MAG: PilW family protein [bacterium]
MNNYKSKGFSLIELMAALTMGLIVVGILIVFYTQERKHQVIIEGRSEALQSADAILRMASREIRLAPGDDPEFQSLDKFKIFKAYYNPNGNDTFAYFADVYPQSTFGNGQIDSAYETFGLVFNAGDEKIYSVRYSSSTGGFVYETMISGVYDFDIIPRDDTGGVVTDTTKFDEIEFVDLVVKTYNERGSMSDADTIYFTRRVRIRSRM